MVSAGGCKRERRCELSVWFKNAAVGRRVGRQSEKQKHVQMLPKKRRPSGSAVLTEMECPSNCWPSMRARQALTSAFTERRMRAEFSSFSAGREGEGGRCGCVCKGGGGVRRKRHIVQWASLTSRLKVERFNMDIPGGEKLLQVL
jgi:hypothetical protein